MSAWRIVVRRLHSIGGKGPRGRFDIDFASQEQSNWAIERAKELNLIRCTKRGRFGHWELTPLGREFCEGRADVRSVLTGAGHRPREFIAVTWLASLPRDIRFGAPA